MVEMSKHWDEVHLRMALAWAKESKDPNTQVGCVIAGPDHETRSTGFNGFPRGVLDNPLWLADREMKNKVMVHAEQNAIFNAARVGISLKGCTLYIVATDSSGLIWGGHPCGSKCTGGIIQAGIVRIVSAPAKGFSKWADDLAFGRMLTQETGIIFDEVEFSS